MGDIIVAVNTKTVTSAPELISTIGLMRSGDVVSVRYLRDNKEFMVSATLGRVEDQLLSGANIHPGLAGVSFAPASTTSEDGVTVTAVEENSRAAQRDLRVGDVITALNRVPVRNLSDLQSIAQGSRVLFLLVKRGERSLLLRIG